MSRHQFKDQFQNKRTPYYCQSWNIIRFAWCVVRIYLCKAVASHEAMVRVHPADNYAVRSHAVKHTHTHAYAQEGRVDIWYMRAMINRLIGNGLIKFTLHIKTGSTHDSTYGVLECVYVTGCVCVQGPAPISGGAQCICPAVIRAVSLSDRCAAKRPAQTRLFISVPKGLRRRAPLSLQESAIQFFHVRVIDF